MAETASRMAENCVDLSTRHVYASLEFRWLLSEVILHAIIEYSSDLQYDEESRLLKTACCSSTIVLPVLSCIYVTSITEYT